MTTVKIKVRRKGGPGSGNWNHKGRPGMVGGSTPSKNSLTAIKLNAATRQPSYNNYLPPNGISAGDYIDQEHKDIIGGCISNVLDNTHVNLSRLGLAIDSKMVPGSVIGYHQPVFHWKERTLTHIGVVVCNNKITGIHNPNIRENIAKTTGIDSSYESIFKHALMHEFGHEAYIQLPGSTKKSWASQYQATRSSNTVYGQQNAVEGFCEMFAKYLNGYDVHPSISEWMDKNVCTTK